MGTARDLGRVGDQKRYANYNKGDREKGSPKGPCFRCGGKHWARDCPDKGDHRLKPPRQVNFVLMATREDEPPTADLDLGTTDPELSFGACNAMKTCFLARAAIMQGKAVIDCGAT